VSDALRDADERVHTLTVQHSAAMNANKDEIRSLQDRLVEFCESAVSNHQVMQTQVDRLRVLCGHVQGDCDFLRLATDTTRSRVTSVQESLEQPLVNFSNECKHRVARLSEEVQKCQSELEDAKDQVSRFIILFSSFFLFFFFSFFLFFFSFSKTFFLTPCSFSSPRHVDLHTLTAARHRTRPTHHGARSGQQIAVRDEWHSARSCE